MKMQWQEGEYTYHITLDERISCYYSDANVASSECMKCHGCR